MATLVLLGPALVQEDGTCDLQWAELRRAEHGWNGVPLMQWGGLQHPCQRAPGWALCADLQREPARPLQLQLITAAPSKAKELHARPAEAYG